MFEQPEHEAALRLLAELVQDLAYEGRNVLLIRKDDRDDATLRLSRGAAGDLRQAADQLAEMVQALSESCLETRREMRLSLAIADASAAVQPLADALDAALAVYLAAPPEEA